MSDQLLVAVILVIIAAGYFLLGMLMLHRADQLREEIVHLFDDAVSIREEAQVLLRDVLAAGEDKS